MSKVLNKISIILVLALMFSLTLPNNTQAADTTTNLTIHKITGDTARTATDGELTGRETPDGNPISNISFTYWNVTKEQFDEMHDNPGKYTTVSEVETYVGEPATDQTGKTAADGTVTVNGLKEGYYWFIEDESSVVQSAAAVPFGLDLPISNSDGTGYINDLHVYPKNTLEETPTIDKDIMSVGKDSATFNVGDSFNWIIKPTTPKGIDEYAKFTVTDTIANTLTFDKSKEITVTATAEYPNLVSGTDFNASYDENTRVVTVDFTTQGLKKIAGLGGTELNIYVPTMINNNATMGANITNTATLSFDNGHGVTGEVSVQNTDIPTVVTGGKNFIKTNGRSENLSGAEFKIKNQDGQYLIQDSETLNITWGDKTQGTVFTSGADGTFFVKGLAFGNYIIEEIKAPTGYTLPTDPETDFTVSENSFYTDTSVSSETAPTATPLEIINKKTLLPNTGGAGTILFTVVGFVLMALGILLLRKRKEA